MKKPDKKRKKQTGLKPQHMMFVMHMTRPGAPTFNNATIAYACVYAPDLFKLSRVIAEGKNISPYDAAYQSVAASASKLLNKDNIQAAINKRMLKLFHDTDALDSRLAKLAYQDADLHVSLAATRDVNKLKKRLNDEAAIPPGAAPINRIEIVMPKRV